MINYNVKRDLSMNSTIKQNPMIEPLGKLKTDAKAIYTYTDEVGNALFTKERYLKKDGSKGYAYSHVVNGKIVHTMPGCPIGTPLYNLHRLAKYPNETVYLVEGEKCVDALTKLRLLARHLQKSPPKLN